MDAASRLTIDLDALAANYARLCADAGAAKVAPVVKADGYGLGAAKVARRLWNEGARRFFVARLAEGERLRAALAESPSTIYVLDGCGPGDADRLGAARLTPVLSTLAQARDWTGPPAALHIDTGMNRLGVTAAEAEMLAKAGFRPELVISHLAVADEPGHPLNRLQLDRYSQACALFPDAERSLANTAGMRLGADYLFDLVRPGIGLYGSGPGARPVAALEAKLLQVREVEAGETVGYGARFEAPRRMRVGVLAAGYADGVIRAAGAGSAWIDGRACPFVGRLSMDLIGVDVSGTQAREGDVAELLGSHIGVDALAAAGGTIAYEVLVRLGGRSTRRYLGTDAADG